MAYVGTPIDTRNQFQSLAGKRFNGDGSTTDFTLDVAPGSTLDIEVFVGNVRQDPNSAYTLSGTTLSFTGAPPSGTNNIYVVHQAKSVGTIDVPASFTSQAQTFSGGLTSSGTTTVSGALTASGGVTLSGTTPTLTIGDAGAEDAKIVFDGNAQDFHIGLDDSTDDLVIGKGSALGTTPAISIDENESVTINSGILKIGTLTTEAEDQGFNFDSTGATNISIASGASVDITTNLNGSGMLLINDTSQSGSVGLFVTGGGVMSIADQTHSTYAVTSSPNSSQIGVGLDSNKIFIKNGIGGTVSLNLQTFRTRTGQ